MVNWYIELTRRSGDPMASIEFANRFLGAPLAERAEVAAAWDRELRWSLPKWQRLSCIDEGPGSVAERIKTSLLIGALSYPGRDARDAIVDFAVIHNSCLAAGFDPRAVFEEIAGAVGGSGAEALRSFANRQPEQQSMEAFSLTAVRNPGGGWVIKQAW